MYLQTLSWFAGTLYPSVSFQKPFPSFSLCSLICLSIFPVWIGWHHVAIHLVVHTRWRNLFWYLRTYFWHSPILNLRNPFGKNMHGQLLAELQLRHLSSSNLHQWHLDLLKPSFFGGIFFLSNGEIKLNLVTIPSRMCPELSLYVIGHECD